MNVFRDPHINEPTPQEVFEGNRAKYREIIDQVEPASENLVVSCVVIASAELENDHFWRLLRSAATQRNVDPEEFEILYVSNQYIDSMEDDEENFGPGSRYYENQDTLFILANLSRVRDNEITIDEAIIQIKNRLGERFTDYEEEVFRLAIDRKVRMVGVDMTDEKWSKEVYPPSRMRNLARDVAGHIAYDRLEKNKRFPGIMDMVDADCEFPSNYFASFRNYASRGDSKVILKRLEPVLTGEVEFSETTDKKTRMLTLYQYYLKSIYAGIDRYTDIEAAISAGVISGPQIAVSPETFRNVGGFGKCLESRNEDFAFSSLALQSCLEDEVLVTTDTFVYVADRMRSDSVDGDMYYRDRKLPRSDQGILDSLRHARAEVESAERDTLEEWLIRDNRINDSKYKQIRSREHKRELHIRRYNQSLLMEAVDVISSGGNLSQMFDVVNKRALDYLGSHKNLEYFLRVLVEEIKLEQGNLDLPQKVLSILVELMPEYFAPINQHEPNYPLEDISTEMNDLNIRDYLHLPRTHFYWQWDQRQPSN